MAEVSQVLLFVLGTLKRGFPLHERGIGNSPFLGEAKTVDAYPLVIAGQWFAPMIFDEPGVGHIISGELYQVDQTRLAKLDKLESVGQPGNFRRPVLVELVEGGQRLWAQSYMKDRSLAYPVHSDLLDRYDDRRFVPPERRGEGKAL